MDINESGGAVQAYNQELGLTFPTLLDENGGVAQRYRVRGIPTSFFISREGLIHAQHTGPLNELLLDSYLVPVL